jgi:precorrin-2 dehydrogenase / sirohydrochlorin ferrochelatase
MSDAAVPYSKAYYPVYLDLVDRPCVVIGGGRVAERKVETLLKYGADVTVISPEVTPAIEEFVEADRVIVERRGYVRGDLTGAFVVICATDSEEINRAVYSEAEECGVLVNVVDVPPLCNFIVPSIVRRGGLQIAISTGGAAPAVAKRVRKRLQEEFGEEWGPYVALLGEVRALAMSEIDDDAERKAFFERVADSDLLARFTRGEAPAAGDVVAEFAPGTPLA